MVQWGVDSRGPDPSFPSPTDEVASRFLHRNQRTPIRGYMVSKLLVRESEDMICRRLSSVCLVVIRRQRGGPWKSGVADLLATRTAHGQSRPSLSLPRPSPFALCFPQQLAQSRAAADTGSIAPSPSLDRRPFPIRPRCHRLEHTNTVTRNYRRWDCSPLELACVP